MDTSIRDRRCYKWHCNYLLIHYQSNLFPLLANAEFFQFSSTSFIEPD
ncbi:hypothetical protein MKP07_29655 [Niabella hibiscisoli]|nr:hypothetical protein [Niabella hibiscisoli]MCH5720086.1 hypothetical protein [Niabella hibiscisoli]